MKTTNIIYVTPATCPFTLNGKNLAEYRRHKLIKISRALGIEPPETKNEILTVLIATLKARKAEPELLEMIEARTAKPVEDVPPESKPAKRSRKKKG